MYITVRNNDLGKALRILKKKLLQEGISKELREFPSENEVLKKSFLKKFLKKILIETKITSANIMAIPKNISHFNDTPAAIPIVIAQK